jgi:hypothetical protein
MPDGQHRHSIRVPLLHAGRDFDVLTRHTPPEIDRLGF